MARERDEHLQHRLRGGELRRVALRARVAARSSGTHAPSTTCSRSRRRARCCPTIVARLDEPMGDSSLLPTYLLCKHARGAGHGRARRRRRRRALRRLRPVPGAARGRGVRQAVPRPVHEAVRLVMARLPVSHANMSLDFRVKRTLRGLSYPPRLWCPVWMGPLDPRELGELFGEPVDLEDVYSEAIEQWEACRAARPRRQDAAVLHQALPAGRHPGQGRPREHDALARGARALPRHRAGRLRAPHPAPVQVPQRRDQVPAEEGARAASLPARDPLPAQEGLRRADRPVVPQRGARAATRAADGRGLDAARSSRRKYADHRADAQRRARVPAGTRGCSGEWRSGWRASTRRRRHGRDEGRPAHRRRVRHLVEQPARGSVYTDRAGRGLVRARSTARRHPRRARARDGLRQRQPHGARAAAGRPRGSTGSTWARRWTRRERNLQASGRDELERARRPTSRPSTSDGYDVVYSIGVLHHLKRAAARASKSVVRNTRPGGRFHCWVYAQAKATAS